MPARTREQHIEMMQDPSLWPLFSVLCMKREETANLPIEEAFAIMTAYDPMVIYKIGVGRLKPGKRLVPQLEGVPRLEYASYADIYDDGWRVD